MERNYLLERGLIKYADILDTIRNDNNYCNLSDRTRMYIDFQLGHIEEIVSGYIAKTEVGGVHVLGMQSDKLPF